jgi:hypothetical protein
MQTEKLVFKSLFGKTDLASQKIELGLVEDIATAAKTAEVVSKDLEDSVLKADNLNKIILESQKELQAAISSVKKAYSVAEKFQANEDRIWEKASKSAADLGLNREDIKGWKEFADKGLKVNSAINGANKYMA